MSGAGLTYQDISDKGAARDPVPETRPPLIHEGETNKEVMVLPPILAQKGAPPRLDRVFLAKKDDPEFAYKIIPKPSIVLNGHGEGEWGEIAVALKLLRVPTTTNGNLLLTFQAPPPREAELVAIKKLNKEVVSQYLSSGGRENPYTEISRLQELGDGIHVLPCVEALKDDEYLYIVTPYCAEGSLKDNIPWAVHGEGGTGYPEDEARSLFQKILDILLYLEQHGICHHDLSPDNFLFYQGSLVLFDFAMSVRFHREEDGSRYLVKPQGIFGTFPCQAPELFLNLRPFDGVGVDLWSAAVILYALLTGLILYRLPHPTDILFKYYIIAGGLAPGLNEQIVEIMQHSFQPSTYTTTEQDQESLLAHAMANLAIPTDALELLQNLLRVLPAQRWTLEQASQSAWVQKQKATD